jgi:hypothetical protein
VSFVVGVFGQNFTVIAADTRLNVMARNGVMLPNDEGALSIPVPGGPALRVPGRYRKIRPLPNGWVAGAGDYLTVAAVLDHLAGGKSLDPVDYPDEIRRLRDQRSSRIRALLRTPQQELDRSHFVYAWVGAEEDLHLAACAFTGEPASETGEPLVVSFPPGFPDTVRDDLWRRLSAGVRNVGELADLTANLRVIAEVFDVTHRHAPTVSARMEIGLLVLMDSVRNIELSGRAEELARLSDREIAQRLGLIA